MLGITKKNACIHCNPKSVQDKINVGYEYLFQFTTYIKAESTEWVILVKRLWKFPWQKWPDGGKW